jgi:hypothetical protein
MAPRSNGQNCAQSAANGPTPIHAAACRHTGQWTEARQSPKTAGPVTSACRASGVQTIWKGKA